LPGQAVYRHNVVGRGGDREDGVVAIDNLLGQGIR
jgi:hypothetical protein